MSPQTTLGVTAWLAADSQSRLSQLPPGLGPLQMIQDYVKGPRGPGEIRLSGAGVTRVIRCVRTFETTYPPGAIALDNSGNIVVADRQGKQVHVLRPDGTRLRSFGLGQLNCKSIAVGPDGNIYVSHNTLLKNRDPIFVFSGSDGTLVRKLETGASVASIAVTADNTLLLMLSCEFGKLRLYSTDGTFREEPLGLFSHAIAIDPITDRLAVCSTDSYCMRVYREPGGPVWNTFVVGSNDTLNDCDYPQSVAIDAAGNTVVADMRSVKIYDSNGTLQRQLDDIKWGFKFVAIDAKGQILVSEHGTCRISVWGNFPA